MERTDSAPCTDAPRPARPLWQIGALLLVLAVLFATSLLSLRGERARKSDDAARLFLSTALQARVIYAFRQMPGMEPAQQSLLRDLKRLAAVQPRARNIRRLALMQHALGEPDWKASLLRLRTLPLSTTPFQAERELAMWRQALEERPKPEQVESLRAQIEELDLGWYEHLALEALYRNAGRPAEARAEADAAQQTLLWLALVLLLGLGLLGTGVLLGVGMALYVLWRRRHPAAPVPPALAVSPPTPISPSKADALYTVFLVFLATRAVLQLAAPLVLRPLLRDSALRTSPTVSLLLSTALMLVSLAVPLAVYLRLSRRVGLTADDIGLRSRRPALDVLWGIGGYAVALPLLVLANLISERLFRGFETPLNPAITEFAGARSLFVQLLLFSQAAVLAPLVEETLFRGVFFRALTPRAGRVGALLIASAVFALLHPQLPLGFLGIFVLGALFNALYALRGSLLPSIVAHAINNGAIFLMLTLLLGD